MNIYIWENVSNLTYRYHDEGGLVIIAKDLDQARTMYRAQGGEVNCTALTQKPTRVIACAGEETPTVFVFPDAGCC